MNGYFETLKEDIRHDYLTRQPKRADVVKNAAAPGLVSILGGTYNRAIIIKDGDSITLQSYDTPVLNVNIKTGEIKKLWTGYTATTLKHINIFLAAYNGMQFNKAAWLAFKGV
jgi:hypothetical protein